MSEPISNSPLVSILAMSYIESTEFLYECLDSILSQTYCSIELVISNDGAESFDESSVIAYIEARNSGNIKNIIVNKNKNNLGTVANCNTALRLSGGDYVMFMACDDVYNNNEVISDMVEGFNSVPPDVLCIVAQTGMYNHDFSECERLFVSEETQKLINELSPQEFYRKHLVLKPLLPAVSAIFKREAFEKYGEFDERYFLIEDYSFHITSTRQGMRYYYLDIMCANHRSDGASNGELTRQNFNVRRRFVLDRILLLQSISNDKTLDENVLAEVNRLLDYHVKLHHDNFEAPILRYIEETTPEPSTPLKGFFLISTSTKTLAALYMLALLFLLTSITLATTEIFAGPEAASAFFAHLGIVLFAVVLILVALKVVVKVYVRLRRNNNER